MRQHVKLLGGTKLLNLVEGVQGGVTMYSKEQMCDGPMWREKLGPDRKVSVHR